IIKKWFIHLHQRNYSENTLAIFVQSLKTLDAFMEGFDIKTIRGSDLRMFISYLARKGYSANTIIRTCHFLRNLFAFCCDNKILAQNPADHLILPQLSQRIAAVLTENYLRIFLSYLNSRTIKDEYVKLRDKAVVELMLFCGLRRNEVRCLKVSHINLPEQTLKVVQGKFRKDRLIPLNNQIQRTLGKYLELRKPAQSRFLILTNTKSNQLDYMYYSYLIRRLSRMAGLKTKVTPKILRNTFATMLFEKGVSLRSIQELMGHTRIGTTAQYISASVNYLREEMNKHPLFHS
ncbi:MAG: tyrosine-type recombinase/integrase, partial [Candidatus Margulisbacteria bacterium]|nr:tyrosine-type recombinase/integrase [Candidatus Margulisiibacteriota bacterium]